MLLRERLTRDFNLRLGCILQHADKYKEAFEVSYAFQSMMFLVNLHNQLDTRLKPLPSLNDLQLLDRELEYLWDEIILLTEQVFKKYFQMAPFTDHVDTFRHPVTKIAEIFW